MQLFREGHTVLTDWPSADTRDEFHVYPDCLAPDYTSQNGLECISNLTSPCSSHKVFETSVLRNIMNHIIWWYIRVHHEGKIGCPLSGIYLDFLCHQNLGIWWATSYLLQKQPVICIKMWLVWNDREFGKIIQFTHMFSTIWHLQCTIMNMSPLRSLWVYSNIKVL